MKLGYNTNGLAHHRLVDAIDLLADLGYHSVAITLDAGALDPYDDQDNLLPPDRTGEVGTRPSRPFARSRDRRSVFAQPARQARPDIDGSRPRRRAVRSDFLHCAIDVAEALGAEAVSLWSGRAPDDPTPSAGLDRLAEGLRPLLAHAERVQIRLAFEPEPGMFIDTLDQFARLDERVGHPLFQLTMDLGHVHCLDEGDIPALVRTWGPRIANVHIEDMVRGVHEHLMFGEGTMNFPAICQAFREIGYTGGLHVELSRHSHMGVDAARAAAEFLRPLLPARP